jgi:hypothetical protein
VVSEFLLFFWLNNVVGVECLPIFQQSVDAELYLWLLEEQKRRKARSVQEKISYQSAIVSNCLNLHDFDLTSFVVREKYVPVRQFIPKRPPDGLNLPRLMWTICKKWNDEFLGEQFEDGWY